MPTTPARPRPIGMVTVLYPGYLPEQGLRERPDLVRIEAATADARSPLGCPPTNATRLLEWMGDNSVIILSSTRAGQRNVGGRWHGRYNLILAQH